MTAFSDVVPERLKERGFETSATEFSVGMQVLVAGFPKYPAGQITTIWGSIVTVETHF